MTTINAIIDVSGVYFTRNEKHFLNNISWQVFPQENWVVFGPNGSGKTTLLRLLTGYMFPSEGKIQILNETIGETDIFALRRKIGWVSNSLESLIHYDDPVIEIVLAGKSASTRLWVEPSKEDIKKAEILLHQFKLNHLYHQEYDLLSQGERKKVLIARALMTDPRILILDEPCEGLDLAARELFLKDLNEMFSSNLNFSVILVTHHVEEIISVFNKILLLSQGKVYATGNIEQYLESKTLSKLFNIDVIIEKKNGRYFSRLG